MHVPDRGLVTLTALAAARRETPGGWSRLFGDHARLYRSGRLALLAGLRAMGSKPPQRMWVPAFVCRAAVEPAVRCGLEVSYYDIGGAFEPGISFRDAAPGDLVLLIHYFGLAGAAPMVGDLCRAHGLRFIEDAAHALPDPDSSVRIGSYGDFAIFSLRKQLPVPDGGVLVVNDPAVRLPTSLSGGQPRVGANALWVAQMIAERLAFLWGWNLLPIEDRLRARGVSTLGVDGAVSEEASGFTLKLMATLDLPALIRRKKANYQALVDRVTEVRGVEIPVPTLPEGSVPQLLPVRLSDPAGVCRALRGMGVGACRWPGADEVQDLALNRYPGAWAWSTRGLFLPVHESLRDRHLDWTARALSRAMRVS